ncbi:MAG: SDR family NAD(P)-dependent oxidoreductase, partial [Candidatus Eisenbacteria bacterium]|nr:SDR family NAD(P)-dependent oxidoreductase [Candidatus Eisenbacteria bacterium]
VPGASLVLIDLDLGDLDSVRRGAEAILSSFGKIDVLVCNAGIMATPYGTTRDGIEQQMGVNYYGHYALSVRLLPLLRATPGARLVTVSSTAQRYGRLRLVHPPDPRKYQRWMAYCDSKLAVVILAFAFDRYFRKHDIDAMGLSGHPGFARTNLRNTRLETETNPWQRLQLQVFERMSMAAERGILPILYAATESAAQGEQYIGVSGIGEVRGDPKISRAQRRAYDPVVHARLLASSAEITGLAL